jgi:CheY-like chemotaxis protein
MGIELPKSRCAILVVDDDDDTRAEMRLVLEDVGYSVVEARDGQDALDVLQSKATKSIRALVLDLRMPRVSGWELLEILKADDAFSRIPVLVTSALPVHGDASGLGATMYWLRKPFRRDELLAGVESCEATVVPSNETLTTLESCAEESTVPHADPATEGVRLPTCPPRASTRPH